MPTSWSAHISLFEGIACKIGKSNMLDVVCSITYKMDIIMSNSREHSHLLHSRFRVEIEGVTADKFFII